MTGICSFAVVANAGADRGDTTPRVAHVVDAVSLDEGGVDGAGGRREEEKGDGVAKHGAVSVWRVAWVGGGRRRVRG